jgi:malonyl-CoA O-methyltransferase
MNSIQEKTKIKTCFNRAAQTYDDHCHLQTKIGKRLIKRTKRYATGHCRIIDLGCGTGNITKKLVETLNYQKVIALDHAEKFLQVAKRLALAVPILLADFDAIPLADNTIDLVFSNMALQWSLDITITLKEISRILSTQGTLIFSIPVLGTFHELLESQRLLTMKALEERFLNNEILVNYVINSGYQIIEMGQKNITFYFDRISQLVSSIKNVGATYKKDSVGPFLAKNYFSDLEKIYLEQFGTVNKQLPLTYSIVFVIAKRISGLCR